MRVQLSDHFTYPRLLRFTLPSITMMIFTSIYCAVSYTHLVDNLSALRLTQRSEGQGKSHESNASLDHIAI